MRRWKVTLAAFLVLGWAWLPAVAPGQSRKARSSMSSGRWVGQDGHDVAGRSPAPGPDGVQDVHIALEGIPAGRSVRAATLTAHGGGEWTFNRPGNAWSCVVERHASATRADLYFQPAQAETGRPFQLRLELDDGRTVALAVQGGRSNPDLRMEGSGLKVAWLGQDGSDHVGPGASVGPDGHQDVHLRLDGLTTQAPIDEIALDAPDRPGWRSGRNPERRGCLEVTRSEPDPTSGDLWFQPDADLAGARLRVRVRYRDGRRDAAEFVGERCDPQAPPPAIPLPRVAPLAVTVRWVGQDGSNRVGPGDVSVRLSGLLDLPEILGMSLTNQAGGAWDLKRGEGPHTPEPLALPLSLEPVSDSPGDFVLRFPPHRDETGSTLTLRLDRRDGSVSFLPIAGGPCDPGQRGGEGPAPGSMVAKPGDDLQRLVDQYGEVRLAPGTFELNQPLTLTRAVTLRGGRESVLRFRQSAGAEPWSAAIKLRHGGITLEGFSVRFAGPVRWLEGIPDGPAVIGTTDPFDPPQRDLIAGIALKGLNAEAPPTSNAAAWEPAPHLARLRGASCGVIESNIWTGGPIEVWGGPWSFERNQFQGTLAGTTSPAVLVAHDAHDLTVRSNSTRPSRTAGKTWRFLVLTGTGHGIQVEDNQIEAVGPRDGDRAPDANAPEIVMTESYSVHFEGRPSGLSPDGRIVQIPPPPGGSARTGSALAILRGAGEGGWCRVIQALDSQTYLIDPPLASADIVVSIASGFVDTAFRRNRIDARGGSVALPFLLAGNHFGTRVESNHWQGGGDAFRIVACPTESPRGWGWTRAPMMGLVIASNRIEGSRLGGLIAVEQGEHARSTQGRVYLSARVRGNLAVSGPPPRSRDGAALTLGADGADAGALIVDLAGNETGGRADDPLASLRVISATVNGQVVRQRSFSLPRASGR